MFLEILQNYKIKGVVLLELRNNKIKVAMTFQNSLAAISSH